MNTRDYINGKSSEGYEFFGSHKKNKGYIFRVLAAGAENVYLQGDFNNWEKIALRKYSTGVFSVSVDQAKAGDKYQYIVEDKDGNTCIKLDPYARKLNLDERASVIIDDDYKYKYKKSKRKIKNIYQLHLGSIFKQDKPKKEIFDDIISHLKVNNFTHLQLMPVSEYKNYKQMGYSSIGLFAFSLRYGSLEEFKEFIDRLHKEKIGIILELDIAEFDPDEIYLDRFDGTNLYNYDYDNIKYNYFSSENFDPSKNIVKSYLMSLISYYTKYLNIDAICFSSVENNIYWQGDFNRGVNEQWCELLRELNNLINANGAYSIASFNGVYNDLDLSFDYIFDNEFSTMVEVFQKEPMNRAHYQTYIRNLIRNSTENKIFGFSYVESYINEASLAMKMYSDMLKIKQLKTLFTFLYTLKSSKMLFMGDELSDFKTFSIYDEFNFDDFDENQKNFNEFYKDLSKIFLSTKVLSDDNSEINLLDIEGYSLYAFERTYKNDKFLIIVNFTDISYEIPAPYNLQEVLNTNDLKYKGTGNVNGKVNKGDIIRIDEFSSSIFKIN